MAVIVAEFFGIIGISSAPPATMAELIPYLLTVTVGLFLVSAVFRILGGLLSLFINFKRW